MLRRLSAFVLLVALVAAHDPYADDHPDIRPRNGAQASTRTVDINSPDRVRIYRHALPPKLFDELEPATRAIAQYEKSLSSLVNDKKHTRWMPYGAEPKTAIEEAIRRLTAVATQGRKVAGAEWWVQLVNVNDPIGFHVDKDESVASLKHYLVHPMWSSVFYVTDIGGGTLIPNQWSPQGNGYEPVVAREGEHIFPEKNKYMLFDGSLLHGVTPGTPRPGQPKERITFLINWWTHKPEAPNCDFLDHSKVKGLKLYSPEEMKAFQAELDAWVASPEGKVLQTRVYPEVLDMTKKSSTPKTTYVARLPGGDSEDLRIYTEAKPGAQYSYKWVLSKAERKARKKAAAEAAAAAAGSSRGDDAEDEDEGSAAPKQSASKRKRKAAEKAAEEEQRAAKKRKQRPADDDEDEEEKPAADDEDEDDDDDVLSRALRKRQGRRERRKQAGKAKRKQSRKAAAADDHDEL